jgi:hypothetical protein
MARTGALRSRYSGRLEYAVPDEQIPQYVRPAGVSWWDYQWNFALHVHGGLAVVPAVNLVRNIGFGPGATHTVSARDARGDNAALPSLSRSHPARRSPRPWRRPAVFRLQRRGCWPAKALQPPAASVATTPGC